MYINAFPRRRTNNVSELCIKLPRWNLTLRENNESVYQRPQEDGTFSEGRCVTWYAYTEDDDTSNDELFLDMFSKRAFNWSANSLEDFFVNVQYH